MKRFAVLILSVFFLTGNVFAQNRNLYQVIDLTEETIYEQFDSLEKGENYSINFPEDFDFTLLDEEFFKYRMINILHNLFESGSSIKFSGPFDYIYYDGMQTINNFSVIKTTISEAPEKKFCVDISNSTFNQMENYSLYRLPDNCFSGHNNLYWVYFGDFVNESVSKGTCSNLQNLQAVFFWNESNIEPSAFMNVYPDALYVSQSMEIVCPLKEYISGEVFGTVKDKYNYSKFTSAYEYDPYSGVQWLIDGDEDCYYGWWENVTPVMPEKKSSAKISDDNEDYLDFPLIDDDEDSVQWPDSDLWDVEENCIGLVPPVYYDIDEVEPEDYDAIFQELNAIFEALFSGEISLEDE